MDQTPIANKKTTNDLQAKKRGRVESDPSHLNSPNELQDPLQALRASDYLAKAVNSEQLLSALRSWLLR